jgi:hypothetical protein
MSKEKKSAPAGAVRDVELKLKDLVRFRQAYETLRVMKIKGGKGARRVGKLLAILQVEYQDYDARAKALIEEHGEEKPGGLGHWVDPDKKDQVSAFGKAHEDLLDAEVDLRVRPISMEDFGDVEVPMMVMSDLHVFFDFKDDEIEDDEEPEPEKSEEKGDENDESSE